jgi:uncharacterized membrane protein
VVAIFLFVFFLHFITQSIKYSVVIQRIFTETQKSLETSCRLREEPAIEPIKEGQPVSAYRAGIFESFNKKPLVDLLKEHNCVISFRLSPGQFVLQGIPLYYITHHQEKLAGDLLHKIDEEISIVDEESIQNNFYYGFRQLTEVAIKALSPGINDPGTAVESVRALVKLLAYRLLHYPDNTIKDSTGAVRIITTERSFEQLFDDTILPVWDYGGKDRFIQNELKELLLQLQLFQDHYVIRKLLTKVQAEINKREP